MYLDESGDHSLARIDPAYPVFVLGGVILDRTYARTVVSPRVQQLKHEFFRRDDLILHTADIIRARNGFESLTDAALRGKFYASLNAVMRELDYEVVACVIDKQTFLARYGPSSTDLYMHSLGILVEQFCRSLGGTPDSGFICAEKRGPQLDAELDKAWARLIREGAGDVEANEVDACIVDLGLKDKGVDVAGLQLADLVVSPIGRAAIGKTTRDDWEIVKGKFRRREGRFEGHGLVFQP